MIIHGFENMFVFNAQALMLFAVVGIDGVILIYSMSDCIYKAVDTLPVPLSRLNIGGKKYPLILGRFLDLVLSDCKLRIWYDCVESS